MATIHIEPNYHARRCSEKHWDKAYQALKPKVLSWIDDTNCAYFYIGQTCNPETRIGAHQRRMAAQGDELWDDMFILYESQGPDFAMLLEDKLIKLTKDLAKYKEGRGFNQNQCAEGGNETFYVYVMTDDTRGKSDIPPSTKSDKDRILTDDRRWALDTLEQNLTKKLDKAIRTGPSRSLAWAFYIGVTANPNNRFASHQKNAESDYDRDYWDRMTVLLETPSRNRAYNMESRLISYATSKATYEGRCMNANGGRKLDEDGRLPSTYVYFLEEKDNGKYGFDAK